MYQISQVVPPYKKHLPTPLIWCGMHTLLFTNYSVPYVIYFILVENHQESRFKCCNLM